MAVEVQSIDPQRNFLLVGGNDDIVKVYNNTGDSLTEIQSLWVGFDIRVIKSSDGRMAIGGLSNQVLFYSHDGFSYVPTISIDVPDSKI